MNQIIEPIIWLNIGIAISALLYFTLLKNTTTFRFNRFFLILVPFVFVALYFMPWSQSITVFEGYAVNMEEFVVGEGNGQSQNQQTNYLLIGLVSVLIIGVVLSLKNTLTAFLETRKSVETHESVYMGDFEQPFSFLNKVFIPKKFKEEQSLNYIINHERIHVEQAHYLDLLVVEFFQVIAWFNPFFWLLRKQVKMNHEFLADQGIVENEKNINDYKQVLLSASLGIRAVSLYSMFAQESPLKRRIDMINKSKKPIHWLRLFTVITIVGGSALMLKSCTEDKLDQKEEQAKTVQSEIEPEDIENIEIDPKFPGGNEALFKYLGDAIVYPESAKEEGVNGVVYCRFIIDKDGSVKNIEVLKGVNPEIDQAAKDAIANMPDWEPGVHKDGHAVPVEYNIPIRFTLKGENEESEKKK
ncbi:M56 family metallopeptidase [Salibacter halophilus]|uniref:M56 family metallopeptidase n=1 Tax=Salibacter halophilus TaxID=1803916 RepID=A0A6N6MBL1_9FLAO|nr:M56 family metallopeptidase [Salibacter halophilus]KAB1065927.1 M56 family metallopeptidase [Salibacter halophilus]